MILHLDYDTTRIGIALKYWPTAQRISDWRNVSLAILAGERNACGCHSGGSPWYLYGCWLGKPIGVDTANPPRPDFAPFLIPAHEYNADGQLVFVLPERWREVAYGRYTGQLWYMDRGVPPPPMWMPERIKHVQTPVLYHGAQCEPMPHICPPPAPPAPEPCVLVSFDIDYGYKCSAHIMQQASVEFSLATCEEEV